MGRKLNKKVHQFFVYCPEDDKSVCNICRSRLSGRNITNIRRHLLSKHEEIYNESVNLEDCEPPETEHKKMKISYSTNEQAIVSSIIKIVTTDENPFMLLDSEGFNEIMEPIYNSLNMTPITSHSILKHISLDGQSLKGKIKTLVKGKLVSLKLDVATRLDKAILVVNLQFILHKSELFVKTLGIIQLEGSYTETYLKDNILHILNEYEINLDQVYSITSDDGRNIIKEVQLLNDATNESLFDDDMVAENVMKKLDAIQLTNVHLLRCPTQTLELCVLDVYKQSDIFEQINACRGVCKALRSGSYGRFLMEQKRNIPPLDVTTRWNTTYIMVQKLFELEEFLSMHPNIDVKPDWDWMELYVDAFKDIYEATLRLQDENLVSSEFFVIWQELKLKFENSRNYIKKLLLVRMRARESELLKSEALLAAIYMDPRVNHILTSEQKWLAKQNLKELAYRLYQSKKSNSSTIDIGNLPHPSGSDSNIQLVNMYADVENFCQMYTRLPLYSNILDFYNKLKLKLPHLNALAQVVLSTSANQVTIERAYASLQFILTEGSSLNHENINDVLLIKLNS